MASSMPPKDASHCKVAEDAKTIQHAALIAVLRVLGQQGDNWQKVMPEKARSAFNQARLGGFLTVPEVTGQANNAKGQFPEDRFVLVRPPEKELTMVCAINCIWDFNSECPIFSSYLGIWTSSPIPLNDENGNPRRPLVFLGYRFETPDQQGTKHKFFHSQPCRSMDRARREFSIAVPHHDKLPTLPLTAKEPADLLVNLALSLHGKDYIRELTVDLMALRFPKAPEEYVLKLKTWFDNG